MEYSGPTDTESRSRSGTESGPGDEGNLLDKVFIIVIVSVIIIVIMMVIGMKKG